MVLSGAHDLVPASCGASLAAAHPGWSVHRIPGATRGQPPPDRLVERLVGAAARCACERWRGRFPSRPEQGGDEDEQEDAGTETGAGGR